MSGEVRGASKHSLAEQQSRNREIGKETRVPVGKVVTRLQRQYGLPRHGNKDDPLDELVFIILSTRTQETIFRDTYERLKEAFPTWDGLTSAKRHQVAAIIGKAGLGAVKAAQITGIVDRLRKDFGSVTLDPVAALSTRDAEAYLTTLPGVSKKVAKCVLMYSLDRQVLPVDTHVHRVAARLGMHVKKRPDTSQDLIEPAVAPALRYAFHVDAVAHGRAICRPARPLCESCCIAQYCQYYQSRVRKSASIRRVG